MRRWTHSRAANHSWFKSCALNIIIITRHVWIAIHAVVHSQFPINNQFPVRILHTALQYSLKVPRCLWATGKVVTIIAGYSFLLHKASYLCKWCWAVGLSLPCSRSPLIQFFSLCVSLSSRPWQPGNQPSRAYWNSINYLESGRKSEQAWG